MGHEKTDKKDQCNVSLSCYLTTCTFLEVRGPLNRNSCNRQTSATTDTRKEATSEAKARRLGLA
jgi:hypothetical protein